MYPFRRYVYALMLYLRNFLFLLLGSPVQGSILNHWITHNELSINYCNSMMGLLRSLAQFSIIPFFSGIGIKIGSRSSCKNISILCKIQLVVTKCKYNFQDAYFRKVHVSSERGAYYWRLLCTFLPSGRHNWLVLVSQIYPYLPNIQVEISC